MPKIPPHATRVFKGVIFDVYQWEQEMFDGSKATFEMVKRPNTVVVIPVVDGKVCYSWQEQPGKPPFLGLFGGRSEEGEEPLVAAKRELLEETGLESDEWVALDSFEPASKTDWTVYYFVARNCRKIADQQLDAGEKIDVRQASIDEFLKIIGDKNFREYELKRVVYESFNPTQAAELKKVLS